MSKIFEEGCGVIVKKILSNSPGEFSFEATDIVNNEPWLIYSRLQVDIPQLRSDIKEGEHFIVEGTWAPRNRFRYGSNLKVIHAGKLSRTRICV